MNQPPPPAVSVVIPAYQSQRTLAGSLEAISRQTFQAFETIVVDSSPGEAAESTRRIVAGFPAVRLERSERRLLPHAARNLGVERSRGELLAFTDPDVYARPDWLERLVAAHRESGEPVVGALACYGSRWLDQGVHLCKFSKWLPGGPPREVDMSPTANMLLSRRQLEAAGGFPGDQFLGDVTLSRSLRRRGHRLGLEPRAVVAHHHLHNLGSFITERYARGRIYGHLRLDGLGAGRGAALGWLAVTVPPVRLARILVLVGLHASRAGQTGRYLSTFPLVAVGHAASLAGEAAAYLQRLRSL